MPIQTHPYNSILVGEFREGLDPKKFKEGPGMAQRIGRLRMAQLPRGPHVYPIY